MRFLIPALLCLASSASAQPASDLLQSGIYHQDTLGDLNAAIRIYRQILSSGAGVRLYTAQAQYRLGTCLLRKGDTAGATEAFQSLIRDYPDQRELVARARESLPRGKELLSAPWSQTELAEYRWLIPGVHDGWSIFRVGSSSDRDSTWRIQMNVYAPRLFITQVDVDRNTMRPLLITYRAPPVEDRRAKYRNEPGRTTLEATKYSYVELLYLLRRMPLAIGWSATLSLIDAQQAPLSLKAAVTGAEEVAVPAGVFKCLKVQLTSDAPHHSVVGTNWPVAADGETLWYGINGARPLVKIKSGKFEGELASLRTAEQVGTSSYRDTQAGYSFTVPTGWVSHPRASFNGPGTSVDLLDPEAQVFVVISGKPKKTAAGNIDSEILAGAEERLRSTRPKWRDYTIRGSMKQGKLGGHSSLSWVADYTVGGRKWVEYVLWVQSESTRASMAVSMDATDFDRFRQRFQPVLDSFRMP